VDKVYDFTGAICVVIGQIRVAQQVLSAVTQVPGRENVAREFALYLARIDPFDPDRGGTAIEHNCKNRECEYSLDYHGGEY
jgi:hypothetical protein